MEIANEEPSNKKSKIVKLASQSSFNDKLQTDQPTDGSIFYEEVTYEAPFMSPWSDFINWQILLTEPSIAKPCKNAT